MTYILIIWTMVGYSASYTPAGPRFDWRPVGEFKNAPACVNAAKAMRKPVGEFICLPTDTK